MMKMMIARLSVLSILLFTAPAGWAQPVAAAKDSNTWIAFVVAILLAVLVVGGAFMSSRRGHQD